MKEKNEEEYLRELDLIEQAKIEEDNAMIKTLSDRVAANILKVIGNPQPKQEELLTIEEASKLLHLTVPTLYTKNSKGELPGVCKQGKRLYFDKKVLIEWIRSGRKKTNAEVKADAETYLNSKKKGQSHE